MYDLQSLPVFVDTSPVNISVIIKYSFSVIPKAKDKVGLVLQNGAHPIPIQKSLAKEILFILIF
jgi:hypothetical protein